MNFIEKVIVKWRKKELLGAVLHRLKKPLKYIQIIIEASECWKHYDEVIKLIKAKIKSGIKIRVAFLICYDSVFPVKSFFEKMLLDTMFDPFIIIIPDISRGKENMIHQFDKSYNKYIHTYGEKKVFPGYNKGDDTYLDHSNNFDIVYFSHPYESMTHKYFQMEYLKKKKVLTCYTEYFHLGIHRSFGQQHVKHSIFCLFWRIFTESKYSYQYFRRYQLIKGKNVRIAGFCKMDGFVECQRVKYFRKRIIVAPHHTVRNEFKNTIPISNFLRYAEFFLELPLLYPDIDFIFRPHPLLFVRLSEEDLWGSEKVNDYLNEIAKKKNMIYSDGGDFFNLFINSDAIIHDCNSFIIDYLFTGYPCCYMTTNELQVKSMFSKFGRECLDQYYKASNKKDILNFIDDIIIRENDILKQGRISFIDKELKNNYPNVSGQLLKEIKEELMYGGIM
jgi:hypothetical protein